jgi:hydroxyacylglutathione hydrolase
MGTRCQALLRRRSSRRPATSSAARPPARRSSSTPNRDVRSTCAPRRARGAARHARDRDAHPRRLRLRRARAGPRTGARLLLSGEGGAEWQYAFAAERRRALLATATRSWWATCARRAAHAGAHARAPRLPRHRHRRDDGPDGRVTGDFVFVGDVGRPDLLERAAGRGTRWRPARARSSARCSASSAPRPPAALARPRRRLRVRQGARRGAVSHARLREARSTGDARGGRGRVRAHGARGPARAAAYFAQMKRINRDGPRILGGFPRPARLPDARRRSVLEGARRGRHAPGGGVRRGARARHDQPAARQELHTWAGWLVPYDRDFYLIADADARTAWTARCATSR